MFIFISKRFICACLWLIIAKHFSYTVVTCFSSCNFLFRVPVGKIFFYFRFLVFQTTAFNQEKLQKISHLSLIMAS